MKKYLYLDTNIFIYISNKKSPFYAKCNNLIKYCRANDILLSTSAETFQEIIYLSKNIKQLAEGLKTAKGAINIVDQIYPITETTIQLYLEQVAIHKSSGSRDLVHLSSCLENNIDNIITYDRDFKKFKQIQSLSPEEFLG